MNLDELEKRVLKPLKTSIKKDVWGIRIAYEDMINLEKVSLQFKQEGNIHRLIKMVEEGNKDEANDINWKRRCSYSMLKAIYVFADMFINVALQEIYNHNQRKWPLKEFCKLQLLWGMSEKIVRDAWCVKTYRNKIVIHQDVDRTHADIGDASGEHRLSPIPEGFFARNSEDSISEDSKNINALYENYKPLYPDLTDSQNYFERLRDLYYKIPLVKENKDNPDRSIIDKIAEKGGCSSMTIGQIEGYAIFHYGTKRCCY